MAEGRIVEERRMGSDRRVAGDRRNGMDRRLAVVIMDYEMRSGDERRS